MDGYDVMTAAQSSKRRCTGESTSFCSTRDDLQTQLAATGMAAAVFKIVGEPRGGRRAMHFLPKGDILACSSTCNILCEWASHYVRSFALQRNGLSSIGLAIVGRIAPRFSQLRSVCFHSSAESRVNMDDAAVTTLARYCVELTDIDIRGTTQSKRSLITDASIISLANGCSHLKYVKLDYCVNITDASIARLASQCSALVDLSVIGCKKLTVATIAALSQTCVGLESLHFGFWYLKPAPARAQGSYVGCASVTDAAISALFLHCPKLTSVIFKGCTSLKAFTLPDGVTTIGDRAFQHCFLLTAITLPDGVTTIEDGAFSCCSSLTAITLPDGVTIKGSAFDNDLTVYCNE